MNSKAIVGCDIHGYYLADGSQAHLLHIVIVHVLEPVSNAILPRGVAAVAVGIFTVAGGSCRHRDRPQRVRDPRQPNATKGAIAHEKCQGVDGINAVLDTLVVKEL